MLDLKYMKTNSQSVLLSPPQFLFTIQFSFESTWGITLFSTLLIALNKTWHLWIRTTLPPLEKQRCPVVKFIEKGGAATLCHLSFVGSSGLWTDMATYWHLGYITSQLSNFSPPCGHTPFQCKLGAPPPEKGLFPAH